MSESEPSEPELGNIQILASNLPKEIENDVKDPKGNYQASHWFFTLNNYSTWHKRTIPQLPYVKEYLFQQETGSNGTPHLQGYLWVEPKQRATKLQNDLNVKFYLTGVKNIENVKKYCSKPKTRTGSIFSNILIPRHAESLSYEELRPIQREVVDLAIHKEPNDRNINVYVGEVGVGKSKILRYLKVNHPKEVIEIPNGSPSDIYNYIAMKDMTYVKTVMLNLTKGEGDDYPYIALEKIKDGSVCSGKYKGSDINFAYVNIIIFANDKPKKNNGVIDYNRFIIKTIV